MGEANLESHNMGPTLSTHIPFVPCQSAIPFLGYGFLKKFDLENPRSRSCLRSKLNVTKWCNILSTHIPFVPCQPTLPFLRYIISQTWPWKIQGQGQMTMMLHNYKSRQFHRTSNGINPSSGFGDMGSHMGQMADSAQLQAKTIPLNFEWRTSVKRL